MTDLLTLLREHDMPPFWDGHATTWTPWKTPTLEVFLCPPPKTPETCHACGSTSSQLQAKGLVAVSTLVTHDQAARREAQIVLIARAAPRETSRPKRLAYWRLFAWRCPDCSHDVVWDIDTDEWFDLDHTDYGPNGSKAP